jgi:hypothetical protein
MLNVTFNVPYFSHYNAYCNILICNLTILIKKKHCRITRHISMYVNVTLYLYGCMKSDLCDISNGDIIAT